MEEYIREFSISGVPKIVFGSGSCSQLGSLAQKFGKKILLITGGSSFTNFIRKNLEQILTSSQFEIIKYPVTGEPSPETVDNAILQFRNENIDVVISIGGGSVIDAGKAIAAMLVTEGNVSDFLEGVGFSSPPGFKIPFIAVPTTSGTGSEATSNAVISRFGKDGFKRSFRHSNYVPDYAVIDPVLTLSCPADTTASSGMDAFTQLIESYVSTNANPMTDALAYSGLKCISRSLKNAFYNGNDLNARTDMSYAALISGITLSNAGLGVIHGFAQPLGSMFPIPHGVVCGSLMAIVNHYTIEKLREENTQTGYLKKYADIGKLFSNQLKKKDDYYLDIFIQTLFSYTDEFKIPFFSAYGVKETDLDEIVKKTSLKNHPVKLNSNELVEIMRRRL